MRGILKPFVVLACLCPPAFAQATPEACRAQLQRFTDVQEYQAVSHVPPAECATTEAKTPGTRQFDMCHKPWLIKLPNRLLFSQDGVEVYAKTPYTSGPGTTVTEQTAELGMNVLLVYQDETVRQTMIKQLRQDPTILETRTGGQKGTFTRVNNLKYANIRFSPTWLPSDLAFGNKLGNPFEREWHVAAIEYNQPRECAFEPDQPDGVSTFIATLGKPAWQDLQMPLSKSPFLAKAFQAMLAWTKESALLIDGQ